jgi:type IX secretion system PorP/SprF family membrane protein
MKTHYFTTGTMHSKPSHRNDDKGRQSGSAPILKSLGCIALVLCSLLSHAQQDPLSAQYIFNPFILNPAYAGFSSDLSASASNRVQWAGFSGSPVTINASGHIALMENKMGMGLTLLQDKIGINKTSEVMVSYAYHVDLNSNSRLSFGLQAGLVNYKNDFNELTFIQGDPKLQSKISEMAPSIGAGIIYSNDNFYLSFSVPKLLEGKAKNDDNIDVILFSQQFYGLVSYKFSITNRLELKPFAMARYTGGAPINTDFGVALNADKSYTLGLFTRNLHSYGAMMKINLGDMFRLGYIFELPSNKSVGLNYTAHEITIGIRISLLRFHNISRISDF